MSSIKRHITIYTKDNCPLCDEAIDVVTRCVKGFKVEVDIVDIVQDDKLVESFDLMVPVVAIDQTPLFYGKVSPFRLTKVLSGEGISARYKAFIRLLPSLFD